MKRKQITTINHFDILSVSHGGTHAILEFYYEMSRWYDVNIITLVQNDIYVDSLEYSNGITIFPVYCKRDNYINNKLIDYVIEELPKDEETISRIRTICANSEIIISEHVYSWNLVKKVAEGKKTIYRSHNVEYDYMRMTWNLNNGDPKLYNIFMVEKDACKNSDFVLTIGENDRVRLIDLYSLNEYEKNKIITIGAGFSQDKKNVVLPSERKGIEGTDKSAFYIATKTTATIDAVGTIINVAKNTAYVTYIIAGSVCTAFQQNQMPANVVLKGSISDYEKKEFLSKCDFAINPIEDGAGVNIKMLEFFSMGLPVITSLHGVRGINAVNNIDVIISSNDEYCHDIKQFLKLPIEKKDAIARNARKLFDDKYSWKSVAEKTIDLLANNWNMDIPNADFQPKLIYSSESCVLNISDDVYIRGAGVKGKECYWVLKNSNIRVKAFIDKYKKGESFDEIPIVDIDSIDKNSNIVVAIAECSEIVKELKKYGVDKKNITLFIGKFFVSLDDKMTICPSFIDLEKLRKL